MLLGIHVFLKTLSSESESWMPTNAVNMEHVLTAGLQDLVFVTV